MNGLKMVRSEAMINNQLRELFQRCTVRISSGNSSGTGFFVARGKLITCWHVVGKAKQDNVEIKGILHQIKKEYPLRLLDYNDKPEIDLALLELAMDPKEWPEHPCVFMDDEDLELLDKFYCFGYHKDGTEGDSTVLEYEGETYRRGEIWLRMAKGQIKPGFSGAPLLDLRTGTVKGIVAYSTNPNLEIGGRAILVRQAYICFRELQDGQRMFHATNTEWTDLLKAISLNAKNQLKLITKSDLESEPNDMIFNLLKEWKKIHTKMQGLLNNMMPVVDFLDLCQISRPNEFGSQLYLAKRAWAKNCIPSIREVESLIKGFGHISEEQVLVEYLSHVENIVNISLQMKNAKEISDTTGVQTSIEAIQQDAETGLRIADLQIEKLVSELEKRYESGELVDNGNK